MPVRKPAADHHEVHALRDGVVSELTVAAGEPVSTGQVICVLAPEADDGAT